jgi:hypothetical protein
MDPSTPQDVQREHLAAIVQGDGMSITDANALLQGKGFAPLNANSREYAEGQKEALLRDDNWRAAYSRGEPEAVAKLYQADLRIQVAFGKLTDRPPSSNDGRYDQLRNVVYQNVQGEGAGVVADRVADIAASLHLDAENAKSMAELSYAADRETANMSEDERATWGDWQLQSLKSALGPDADNKLKVASEVISKLRGVKTDVAATVRESGAQIGFILIATAQNAAYRNKW